MTFDVQLQKVKASKKCKCKNCTSLPLRNYLEKENLTVAGMDGQVNDEDKVIKKSFHLQLPKV